MVPDKHLIIGAGEIGQSLFKVLRKGHDVSIRDKEGKPGRYDVLHICFPFTKNFIKHCPYQNRLVKY